jgi:hypothetical protein
MPSCHEAHVEEVSRHSLLFDFIHWVVNFGNTGAEVDKHYEQITDAIYDSANVLTGNTGCNLTEFLCQLDKLGLEVVNVEAAGLAPSEYVVDFFTHQKISSAVVGVCLDQFD